MASPLRTDVFIPYKLTRLGVVMTPEVGNELEAEGVLNPGSGRTPDGELYLLPRLVAAGNVSRVGLARVVLDDGVPVGVEREGVVLAPDAGWERGAGSAGTEDPRVIWIEALGLHVMSYVAYGPMGPRPALAVSENLRDWRRLGPLHFVYQPELDLDLNLFRTRTWCSSRSPCQGPTAFLRSPCCTARCGTSVGSATAKECTSLPASLMKGSGSGSPTSRWKMSRPTSTTSSSSAPARWWRCRSTTSRHSRSAQGRPPSGLRRDGSSCITARRAH